MSTSADGAAPSPRSTASASDSEEEMAGTVIRMKSIKTIAEMYKSGVLKAASPKKLRCKPDPALLQRVSLLYVLLE